MIGVDLLCKILYTNTNSVDNQNGLMARHSTCLLTLLHKSESDGIRMEYINNDQTKRPTSPVCPVWK
ncbi:hypothetical protein L6452_01800 [Arctium lappa]|uniref:Uncharacterized protein n=1 Tax=Arctium lappa TaxID=4217 RepID=A0ACB9FHS3_ARCLA|nr:hypothetical protein L6452_01800 [Arctium lappa]